MMVKIQWDDDCVKTTEDKTTVEKVKKKCWNPDEHGEGSWIEDL